MPYSLSLALASLAIALICTPLVMRYARRAGALDHPGPRRIHREPVPTLGGLGFVAAVLGVAWVARALPGPASELDIRPLVGLTFAAIPIVALGVVDDLRGAAPIVKLTLQVCGALVLVLFGYNVPVITNPFDGAIASGALGAPLTVVWVVVVINAVNLIDGLDGLASGVVAIAAGTLWWVGRSHGDFQVMFFSALLIGATLGFLRYNFPPARVFMGDTGSHFLGLTLAALALIENRKGTATVTLLFPLVAMGLPIADSVLAFVRRLVAGRPVFRADSGHIHHRLLRLGLSDRAALFTLWGLCALLGIAAVLLSGLPRGRAGALALGLALLLFAVFEWIEILDARRLAALGHDGHDPAASAPADETAAQPRGR
jgi:UDP-GlcNAc:undecaprenyl-phosphate GlcNAc-1-phosphate transferase